MLKFSTYTSFCLARPPLVVADNITVLISSVGADCRLKTQTEEVRDSVWLSPGEDWQRCQERCVTSEMSVDNVWSTETICGRSAAEKHGLPERAEQEACLQQISSNTWRQKCHCALPLMMHTVNTLNAFLKDTWFPEGELRHIRRAVTHTLALQDLWWAFRHVLFSWFLKDQVLNAHWRTGILIPFVLCCCREQWLQRDWGTSWLLPFSTSGAPPRISARARGRFHCKEPTGPAALPGVTSHPDLL